MHIKKIRPDFGFTIIELLVTMGIIAVLFGISSIGLSMLIPNTSQSLSYDSLVNDIRAQQTLAMSSGMSHGIYFESNSYTLFEGDSYAGGSNKLVVPLGDSVNISNVTFAGNQVVFQPGSGDILNYSSNNDSVTLTNSVSDKAIVIKVNKYGADY